MRMIGPRKTALKPHYALIAGAASVIVVSILIAAKGALYAQAPSASVLASLMDSLSDAVVSVMNFLALRFSLKPADGGHRYGHGKIEGLAALGQSALIAAAAGLLLWESIDRFLHPHPVSDYWLGAGVMVFAIALSAGLVWVQNYSLRHAPSLAVEADKAHYEMDILINGGVIVILAALYYGAPLWLDPLFALAVCMYLGKTVYDIGRQGLDMLLDHELPAAVRQHIIDLVKKQEGVMGVHDLRTTRSGMRIFISFDIEVDPDLPLRAAHDIVRRVEKALLTDFPHAEIMIHADPFGDPHDSRHGAHD